MGSLVTMCTGQSAVCLNKHEPNCCRCCHCGCALLDDPGSAVCRAHEARRLKPLHASSKTGPNWRPSAVHGPASTCNFVLSLARTFQAIMPLTFFLQRGAGGSESEKTSAPCCRALDDSAPALPSAGRWSDRANLSSRGSLGSSKVTCGDGCSPFRAMPRRSQRQFDCPGGRAMSFTRSAVAQ